MGQEQERRRFFCRFCSESFSNGRVLGGHMRTHLGKKKIDNQKMGSEENDDSGYVLRENPKKSQKFSAQVNLCQVCGKGFESPRALFGHLRHHSIKERNSIQSTERVRVCNGSEPETGLSDNERSGPVRKKRSKRVMRYKNFSSSCSFSDFNESSSVTEHEHEHEQEVEDVALCLMMLSRGVRNWDGFVSVCESSENNSVSFEVKQVFRSKCVSDSVNVVSREKSLEFCENESGFVFKKPKLDDESETVMGDNVEMIFEDSAGLQSVNLVSGPKPDFVDFDSKQYKCRIDESETVMGDNVEMIFEDSAGLQTVNLVSGPKPDFVSSDSKQYKCRIDGSETVLFGGNAETIFEDSAGLQSVNLVSRPKPDFVASDSKQYKCRIDGSETVLFGDNAETIFEDSAGWQSVNLISGPKPDIATSDSKQYKCRICSKSFQTHQALGGHCNAHKSIKSRSALKTTVSFESEPNCKLLEYECDETSEENEISSSSTVMKSKIHTCPVCYKVFRSGQALGGHKKAHFYKGAEPQQDEADVDVGFKQWWGGSNYSHGHETLLGF